MSNPVGSQFTTDLDFSQDSEEVAFVATMLGALGSPVRVRIAMLLAQGERTVNEVAQALGIAQPSASINLATLQRAGIVTVRAMGNQRCYAVRGPRVAQIMRLALEFRGVHIENILKEPALDHDELALDDESNTSVDPILADFDIAGDPQ